MVTQIETFLGVNEDIDTQLRIGEASSMTNYRVTQSGKLEQIEGYEQLFASIAAKPIRGQWYGKIGATYYHLLACNGTLYKNVAGTPTSIGSLTDADTFFFYNGGKVYIMNGTEYKSFDGTNLIDVAGYIPTIYTATPPTGGGTAYEGINLLTGWKKQSFSGNGSATAFYLAETSISADTVLATVSGVANVENTDFTVDRTLGKVTFNVAPANYPDNVVITWNKTNASNRAEISGCRKAVIFGTRVHVWGNATYKNRRWHGGIVASTTSAEYFPATQVHNIGPDRDAITDIVTQYDRQIILTDGGRAFYSYYLDVSGVITFPVFELNETVGNNPFGQAAVLDNDPVSIQSDGVYRWTSTGVRDERNAQHISKRIQKTLDTINTSDVKTYDWQENRELWIASGKNVVVYNYGFDCWYTFTLNDSVTSMLAISGAMHFGTTDGRIMKFDTDLATFNGVAIPAEWMMGYYDWGQEWSRKFTNAVWITMKPGDKVNLDVYWETDRDVGERQASQSIGYHTFSYGTVDYGDWTYNLNFSPKPQRVRTKAKKFAFWRIILRNSRLGYTSTVLGITLDARIGGNVK